MLTFLIIFSYLALVGLQSLNFLEKLSFPLSLLRLGSLCVLFAHGYYLYSQIELLGGQNLHPLLMLSLTLWVMGTLIFLSFNEALTKLNPFIYVVSALSVVAFALNPKVEVVATEHNRLLLFHILVSFLATSVLLLCATQAMVVSVQNTYLKKSLNHPFLKVLPPLEHMETLLFMMLWAGFFLLTFSLGSGYFYYDHLLSPQLLPKTLLATLAWVMFGLILGARVTRGLRGQSAVRLTSLATGLLFLSYFGTKFIFN